MIRLHGLLGGEMVVCGDQSVVTEWRYSGDAAAVLNAERKLIKQ